MPTKPTLFVRPEVRRYGPGEAARLASDLLASSTSTLVEEVASASSLRLKPDGSVAGGRRYTVEGLRQVCQVACPGLFQVVADMAGTGRRTARDDGDVPGSIVDATAIFNRVIELRFDSLFAARQRLIVDLRARTIDGLLGPGYTQIENVEVFERAAEAALQAGDQVLDRATLAGRLMTARFASLSPLFSIDAPPGVDGDDAFHAGTHLVNSEVGGESTLRAAPALRRARDGTCSLGRWLGGRRVHAGREFRRKAETMFAEAAAAEPDAARTRAAMLALRAASLGLAGDTVRRAERLEAIVSRLRDAGLQLTVARRVALDAAYRGAYGPPGQVPAGPDDLTAAAGRRSSFDLYAALTAAGRDLYDHGQHEGPERAAHALLHGRMKLN